MTSRTPSSAAPAPAPQIGMSGTVWAMLIALSVLWGGSFFFAEVAVRELPPLTIVSLRVGLAAVTLWLIIAAMGLPVPRQAGVWGAFFVMGFLNNVIPFSLIVWGQTHIASGLASILNATTPMFTVVVAGLLLRDERPTWPKVAAVLIGFAGVATMFAPSLGNGEGAHLPAQAAVLGAAFSYALAGVYGRRFQALGVNPVVTAAGQVTASTILLVPVTMLVETPLGLPLPSLYTSASIVGLAVLSTALAYILYFRILASAGATNLLLVTLLIPVSAILLGSTILGETLTTHQIAGMALIGAGLLIMDGRLLGFSKR